MRLPMDNNSKLPKPKDLEIKKEILEAARQHKLIFFIGNGLSRLYNLPDWDSLANNMLRGLAKKRVLDYNLYELLLKQSTKAKISIADHHFKHNKTHGLSYSDFLSGNNILNSDSCPAYTSLAKCGVKFITTNYDGLIKSAYDGLELDSEPIQDISTTEELSNEITKKAIKKAKVFDDPYKFKIEQLLEDDVIFHLHGSLNNENNLIASTKDYLKLYADKDVRTFLHNALHSHTVVFVGYGLEELEILDLILRASESSSTTEESNQVKSKKYLLMPMLYHQEIMLDQLEIYYSQLGITLLPFNSDSKGYDSLEEVLDNWFSKLGPIVASSARPKINEIDTIKSMLLDIQDQL